MKCLLLLNRRLNRELLIGKRLLRPKIGWNVPRILATLVLMLTCVFGTRCPSYVVVSRRLVRVRALRTYLMVSSL